MQTGCVTNRGRRGFTLIELLVVVAIITVLIAILLPNLSRARDRAKLVVCGTQIRAWGQGFIVYGEEYNGLLPLDGGNGTTAAPIGKWSDPWLWFNGVTTYMGTGNHTYDELQTGVFSTGDAPPPGTTPAPNVPDAGSNSLFICPSAFAPAPGVGDVMTNPLAIPPYPAGFFLVTGWYAVSASGIPFAESRPMLLCYGMNSQLRDWNIDSPSYGDPSNRGPNDISNIRNLKPPSLVPLVAEKRVRPDELPAGPPADANFSKNLAQSKVTANRFAARHDKGGNIVFADGHVDYMKNKTINTGPGAIKANNYNIPGVLLWNPTTVAQ